jgi:hypothetical protein
MGGRKGEDYGMSNEIKPIVLKARSAEDGVGVVRLTPEAEKVVRRLHIRSHLPIRQIVSEIIIQSESLIDIDLSAMEEDDQ